MVIVDAHLDVAWNVLYNGRDLARSVREIRASESRAQGIAMTSLNSFGEAGVGVVFATLYAQPAFTWSDIPRGHELARPMRRYDTPQEAEEPALEMLAIYEAWAEAGQIRIITDRQTLEQHLHMFRDDRVPGFLIAMEGADPIVSPDDLPRWFARAADGQPRLGINSVCRRDGLEHGPDRSRSRAPYRDGRARDRARR